MKGFCSLVGGTYFEGKFGSQWGCLFASGAYLLCDEYSCWYIGPPRTEDTDPGDVALPPAGGVAVDTTPLPGGLHNGVLVVAVDAYPELALAHIQEVAGFVAATPLGPVTRVLSVEGSSSSLSGAQADALLNRTDADGVRLVDVMVEPAPDTKLGQIPADPRLSHMRVFAIAVDPDGAQGNPPQLNIIVLHW